MAEPHRESGRKGVASFKAGAETAGSAEEIEQLVLTFNAAMGEIVKVEKVDKAGKRQELTEEECAKLAGQDEVEEIEAVLASLAQLLREGDEAEHDLHFAKKGTATFRNQDIVLNVGTDLYNETHEILQTPRYQCPPNQERRCALRAGLAGLHA